jgi:MazG family protein
MVDDQNGSNFPRLVAIMQRLLAPNGCPWDREQTLQSLRTYVIEEAYEVADAIDSGNLENLCEELGDLQLQIVFQAELARRQNLFCLNDVIDGICDKLIHRHPHVFGDAHVSTASEVRTNWELLKNEKKQGRGVLDGVPASLPALLRALRVGQKAARIGLDWPDSANIRDKISEELAEFDEAVANGDNDAMQRELGDVLFSLANFARKKGIDPETALRETLNRFTSRVRSVETAVRQSGRSITEMTAEELDGFWEAAKAEEAT